MRRNLDLLIALLDAVRRSDRDAIVAELAPDATWTGIREEWHCETPAEIADMFLERSAVLGDLADLELLGRADRAVLHLRRLRELGGQPLSDGIYVVCRVADGRITRLEDHVRRRDALPGEGGAEPSAGVPEAPLRDGVPDGAGWYVLNVADARWLDGAFGAFTRFEGDVRHPRIGVNVAVLHPGQPLAMYHREDEQEDFLVLQGEATLIVEDQERPLRAWDYVHCPPWATHIIVGAGDRPCTLVAIGGRDNDAVVYPRSEVALRHSAGVSETTDQPDRAYAPFPPDEPTVFRSDWLP